MWTTLSHKKTVRLRQHKKIIYQCHCGANKVVKWSQKRSGSEHAELDRNASLGLFG